jgi:L-asparaginase II
VVDSSGSLLAWHADPHLVTFLRSSSKPFQLLPFIERGGDQAFHLTSREVALMCASHDGTDEHVEVLKGIQTKVGIQEVICCAVPTAFACTYRGGDEGTAKLKLE